MGIDSRPGDFAVSGIQYLRSTQANTLQCTVFRYWRHSRRALLSLKICIVLSRQIRHIIAETPQIRSRSAVRSRTRDISRKIQWYVSDCSICCGPDVKQISARVAHSSLSMKGQELRKRGVILHVSRDSLGRPHSGSRFPCASNN